MATTKQRRVKAAIAGLRTLDEMERDARGKSPEVPSYLRAVDAIRAIMYADGPGTEWTPDTLDEIVAVLRAEGFGPK